MIMEKQELNQALAGKVLILVAVITTLTLVLGIGIAMAALPAHMELEGETLGKIEGSCTEPGREGTILVYQLDHSIHVPLDVQSGQLTGQKTHGPLTIVKEFDSSSPLLYRALCNGERLPVVEIKFYRIDQTGSDVHYFTITLEDAIIVEMKPYFPIAFLPENEPYRHMEEVSFTYRKIKWTWHPDGTGSEDPWLWPTNLPPVASFTFTPTNSFAGDVITFAAATSHDPDGYITTFEWDFGDGNTATGISPTHTYAQSGTYTVSLTVIDNNVFPATDTKTTTIMIADTKPIADFTGAPTSGLEPLIVVFTDASVSHDGITAWEWDFGDGVTSTEQNPDHTYSAGTYTVSLTVTEDDGDNDTDTKVNYITVSEVLQPELCPDEYRWGSYNWDPFPDTFIGRQEVRFVNTGKGDAYNVIATVTCMPINIVATDPTVTLGDIPAADSVWSSDTFELRVDMTNPQDPNKGIVWLVEYDDANGKHHMIENIPIFCGESINCP